MCLTLNVKRGFNCLQFDLSLDIWPHQDHRSEKYASLQEL